MLQCIIHVESPEGVRDKMLDSDRLSESFPIKPHVEDEETEVQGG